MQTAEQIVNGLVRYTDREVIPKLGTAGKWVVGAIVGMAGNKTSEIIMTLQANEIAKVLGATNEDGLYDVDLIADNLKTSAERYGKLQLNVPIVGILTFDGNDVDNARKYIKGELV